MNPHRLHRVLFACIAAILATALAFAGFASVTLPDSPVPVVWDKASCAHCRMHLGEPPFAAQMVLRDGTVAMFDDPGCLFQFAADEPREVHATWFHQLRGDGWISAAEVAFVAVEATPMGFGLGAVPRATAGAIDLATARDRCLHPRNEGVRR